MKLNLGCGTDIRKGYVNLDISPLPDVDVVHDINKLPLPFPDKHFDEIICNDVLEHVSDFTAVFQDLCRILAYGGVLKVHVPHFTSSINYTDPTHKNMFSVRKFLFFVQGTKYFERRSYYFDNFFSSYSNLNIGFDTFPFIYNIPIFILINLNLNSLLLYEDTLLSRLFPASSIYVELIR